MINARGTAVASYDKIETPDGEFSEEIYPIMRGYKLACCDCGLVHDIEYNVVKVSRRYKDGSFEVEVLDPKKYRVEFRVRRNARSTAMIRRWKMPKNSKVDKMFQAIKRRGVPVGEAAAIAQARTGLSLKTGRKPKSKKGKSK
jgi:hypothetical protein